MKKKQNIRICEGKEEVSIYPSQRKEDEDEGEERDVGAVKRERDKKGSKR